MLATVRAMILVALAAVAGCISSHTAKSSISNGIEQRQNKNYSGPDYPTSENGVLTVYKVRPKSEVALIAPDVEHVVWRRYLTNESFRQNAVVTTVPFDNEYITNDTSVDVVVARERWALLEKDMDFGTKIRDLDMCKASNKECFDPSCYRNMEPCIDPELYVCFTTKVGNYCLEKANQLPVTDDSDIGIREFLEIADAWE